jgi:hypothetical protein
VTRVPREPFSVGQYDYVERMAGGASVVWHRAIEHLKRQGADRGELARLLQAALDAESALKGYCCHKRMEWTRKGWR